MTDYDHRPVVMCLGDRISNFAARFRIHVSGREEVYKRYSPDHPASPKSALQAAVLTAFLIDLLQLLGFRITALKI
ncbi:hypothetical protein [Candidatus Palauibacter sp.]|uniref:hypothetical protein n=1 Tax=Candidatus Palauibacter sp. TaxID=3101350 RepID=UPI003C6FB968